MTTLHSKTALRQHLRQTRNALSADDVRHASQRITRTLLELPQVHAAQHIAAYSSHHNEVCTTDLIDQLHQRGCHLYLPVVSHDQTKSLSFHLVTPGQATTRNRFGIREPNSQQAPAVSTSRLAIMVVPLLGHTAQCDRIGRGGGYYDRCLSQLRSMEAHCAVIGLAYDCQLCPSLPTDPWDQALDMVVTPTRIYHRQTAT